MFHKPVLQSDEPQEQCAEHRKDVADVRGHAGLGYEEVIKSVERHRDRQGADDAGEGKELELAEHAETCRKKYHRDDMHDADGRTADEDVDQVLCAGSQDEAAVLESCEACAYADGRKFDIFVFGLEDIEAEKYRKEFHDLLDDRGYEDRRVFGAVAGDKDQEAADICGQEADYHAGQE